MSGICALVNLDGAPVGREELEALAAPLALNAPGKVGFRLCGNVGVACLDAFGNGDGFLHEDGDLLVACDAELYDRRSVPAAQGADALGAGAQGLGEAALIAALYRKHGKDWCRGVEGTFAAFIWDKRDRTARIYTDRVGVKPIVWREDGRRLCAATTVLSVAAMPGYHRQVEPQALLFLLQMEVIPTPFTIFAGIRKLESGHALVLRGAGPAATERYWDMTYPAAQLADPEAMKKTSLDLLRQAVARRLEYEGDPAKVGCFLSGGVDSSTIVGLASQLHPGAVRTYSIGFDENGYDEMHYARIAAKAFGTQHTEYYVTPADVVEALPALVRAYDEPFANSSVIPAYFCSRLARQQGMTAILGGDGGDEIFGGNVRYHETFALAGRLPPAAADLLWKAFRLLPPEMPVTALRKIRNYLSRLRGPLEERIHAYSLTDYIETRRIFAPELLARGPFLSPAAISAGYLDRVRGAEPLNQFLYNDLKLTLMDNDLRKVERAAALAGIKPRYPFLAHDLIEYTGRIPPGLKIKDGRLRYLFKEAAASLLPAEILTKTKHGFGIPVSRWLMRPGRLNEMLRDALFGGTLQRRGIFRAGFLEELDRRGRADGGAYYGTYLYYVLFLELWLRQHVDGASGPASARNFEQKS